MLGASVYYMQIKGARSGNSLKGVSALELDLDRSVFVQAKRIRSEWGVAPSL